MMDCLTCELTKQRDEGKAPLRDNIYRGQHWDVVHAFNTSLPGWLVLIARRHIAAVDEMTDDEAVELGRLIRQVSVVLKQVMDCSKTYVIQFAEAPKHPHVHFHIVPRMSNLPTEYRGPNIFKHLGIVGDAGVTDDEMDRIALEVRHKLLNTLSIGDD